MKSIVLLLVSVMLLISCEEMPKTDAVDSKVSSDRTLVIDTAEENFTIEKTIPKVENEDDEVLKTFATECNFGDIQINIEEKQNKLYIHSNSKMVDDFSVGIKGMVDKVIETDVNADGYNEFYCVTNSGDLIAYSSYRNKSFGEIYIPQRPYDFYKDFNELKFWEVKNKKLLLTFSNGTNEQLNIVRYHLKSGEAGYKLIAE